MKKKILSFLIMLCMITALLPTNVAFAATTSGTCGDNLTWTLNSNGTLIISGTGNMKNYFAHAPWYSYSESLKSVIVQNGVTSIGNYAFKDCKNITQITLSASVNSIGKEAFSGCNFETIELPTKITIIPEGLFMGCKSLKKVKIPNGVTEIGDNAFQGCENLSELTLPNEIKSIGDAFYYCGIINNATEDVVYNNGYLLGAKTSLSGKYTIKKDVTLIASGAFSQCENLTEIVIPEGITSIPKNTFQHCRNLKSVSLPNTLTSIGTYAFYYCEKLESISIPSGVTVIPYDCFAHSGLVNIEIPEQVTDIEHNAFYECKNAKTITIGKNVQNVANAVFAGCINVQQINWNAKNASFVLDKYDDNYFFDDVGTNADNTTLIISDDVEEIQDYVFSSEDVNPRIRTVITGDTIKKIMLPYYVEDLTIGKNINSVDFYSTRDLKKIAISANNPNFVAENNIVFNKNKTEIIYYPSSIDDIKYVIPNTVTTISDYAFHNSKIKELQIPNSVSKIGRYFCTRCSSLEKIYYNGTSEEWKNISIDSTNSNLNKVIFLKCKIILNDNNGNEISNKIQNYGEIIDTSSITVPDGYAITLYKDQALTEEYSLDTPIRENLNLYYDIIEINKLKITGAESADIGQKGITESVTFATDKAAKDFIATVKYSDKLNLAEVKAKDFSITEQSSETNGGYTYLYLTCTYKNDGNMPKNTTLNPFDLVFDVSESATANEKLTIEFVNDETFLADSGANTYDFEGLGKAEIKVNPIFVSGITINGADEIDKATQYTAVILPENATNKDIEWTVDNSDIATISVDGILTPVKAGTVKIKATAKGGNDVYAEKLVNVKVYATITSLTASVGEWDKTFTPSEREYTIYVPKNTASIKLKPQYNGTLKLGTQTLYNNRNNNITLSNLETVLTLNYSETGYTDSEYKIKIVKFEGTKTTVSEDGKSFTIKPINIANGNTVILALYNGEEFVTMQSSVYSGTDIPFTVTDDYTTAKVMVWNNLDDIKPICDVEIVK